MFNILFFPFRMGFFGHLFGLVGIGMLGLYFLPTIVALVRRKSNAGAIFLLNFFLGWTFIGWIVSLIWAVSGDPRPQQVIIHNNVPPPERQATSVTIRQDPPASQARYQPASRSNASSQQDKINQLRQLKDLLDNGVLTQEEFNQQKAKIL